MQPEVTAPKTSKQTPQTKPEENRVECTVYIRGAMNTRGAEPGGEGVPMFSGRVNESRGVGSEGAADKCSGHLDCSEAIPGGLEVQSLGKGLPGLLTGWAAGRGRMWEPMMAPDRWRWTNAAPILPSDLSSRKREGLHRLRGWEHQVRARVRFCRIEVLFGWQR